MIKECPPGLTFKGRKHTEETKLKMRMSSIGSKNALWKGDQVGYKSLHEWIRNHLPKPELCQQCNSKPPYDVACIGLYDRDPNSWKWWCRGCHMQSDGRMKNLTHNHEVKT